MYFAGVSLTYLAIPVPFLLDTLDMLDKQCTFEFHSRLHERDVPEPRIETQFLQICDRGSAACGLVFERPYIGITSAESQLDNRLPNTTTERSDGTGCVLHWSQKILQGVHL